MSFFNYFPNHFPPRSPPTSLPSSSPKQPPPQPSGCSNAMEQTGKKPWSQQQLSYLATGASLGFTLSASIWHQANKINHIKATVALSQLVLEAAHSNLVSKIIHTERSLLLKHTSCYTFPPGDQAQTWDSQCRASVRGKVPHVSLCVSCCPHGVTLHASVQKQLCSSLLQSWTNTTRWTNQCQFVIWTFFPPQKPAPIIPHVRTKGWQSWAHCSSSLSTQVSAQPLERRTLYLFSFFLRLKYLMRQITHKGSFLSPRSLSLSLLRKKALLQENTTYPIINKAIFPEFSGLKHSIPPKLTWTTHHSSLKSMVVCYRQVWGTFLFCKHDQKGLMKAFKRLSR